VGQGRAAQAAEGAGHEQTVAPEQEKEGAAAAALRPPAKAEAEGQPQGGAGIVANATPPRRTNGVPLVLGLRSRLPSLPLVSNLPLEGRCLVVLLCSTSCLVPFGALA
jgi:hypothetical protein